MKLNTSIIPNVYSEVIRNETLRGQRHVVSKECRQQVRAQLFQQRENINLDPKLKSLCQREIKQLCSDAPQGGGQVNTVRFHESRHMCHHSRFYFHAMCATDFGVFTNEFDDFGGGLSPSHLFDQKVGTNRQLNRLHANDHMPRYDPSILSRYGKRANAGMLENPQRRNAI